MLTALRIKNFKAWRDTGSIKLAPLTVLFGSNSSGKSSIQQLLMLLRQTVESPDRRRVLHFGDKSSPVDLGSFREAISGHDVDAALQFSLDWSLATPLIIEDTKNDDSFSVGMMGFDGVVDAISKDPVTLSVARMLYRLYSDEGQLDLGLDRESDGYRLHAEGYHPVAAVGRKWPVSAPGHFHAFPDDTTTRFQNLEFHSDLTFELEKLLTSISYLGPLREPPERLYRWPGDEPDHVGWSGERTIDALLAGRRRAFNLKERAPRRPLQVVVAGWLKQLGMIDDFALAPLSEGLDQYMVRVRAPHQRDEVMLTDVGFGVSQVLPVVTQCFYARAGSTVVLEQPEIHLHPSVQSGLADLFIEAIRAREERQPRDLQLIVESHSEHLLRRLLRRIAEQEIEPEDVALYFAIPTPNGSRLERLEVDLLGQVHNWPPDFFGDQMGDVAAQTREALKRRRHVA